MTAVTHNTIELYEGEPAVFQFTITDGAGAPQSLVGATLSYRLANNKGDTAILEKTEIDGITVASNVATVRFDTSELVPTPLPNSVDFWGELWVTISGNSIVVADGLINVKPSIQV